MTQQFTDDVFIDGSADETQLRVQGTAGQSAPLQTWEDDTGSAKAQVSGTGRLQVGDSTSTDESLIEAHNTGSGTTDATRGINTLGRLVSPLTDVVSWLVSELELPGTGTISGMFQAVRGRLTHSSTGDSSQADLRAGDFEAVNRGGDATTPVGKMVGVQGNLSNDESAHLSAGYAVNASVNNASNGTIEEAAALHVESPTNTGTITTLSGLDIADIQQGTTNYAIRTGKGLVHLGDVLEVVEQSAAPAAETGVVRMYAKTDGRLYALDASGNEHDLLRVGQTYGARVYNTTTQTILAADSYPPITFNQVRYDYGNLYSASATDRLTAPVSGLYTVSAGITLSASVTGAMAIVKLGTGRVAEVQINNQRTLIMHTTLYLDTDDPAGKSVQLKLNTTTDVDIVPVINNDYLNFFTLTYQGGV